MYNADIQVSMIGLFLVIRERVVFGVVAYSGTREAWQFHST